MAVPYLKPPSRLFITAAACAVISCALQAAPLRGQGAAATGACKSGAPVVGVATTSAPLEGQGAEATLPAPSALFSRTPPDLRQKSFAGNGARWLLLRGQANDSSVLASIIERSARHFDVVLCLHRGPRATEDTVVALEHLYAAVLERSPTASYKLDLGIAGHAAGLSHGAALQRIAAARERAVMAHRQSGETDSPKWEVVRLRGLPAAGLHVRVQVLDGVRRPLAGAQVSFARGEHYICSAETDVAGIAQCALYNSHRDDADEDVRRDWIAPTVASFGGVVHPALIQLPTTLLYRNAAESPDQIGLGSSRPHQALADSVQRKH